MMSVPKPIQKPPNPRFSSGPCNKPPGWQPDIFAEAIWGRSHRCAPACAQIAQVIEKTKKLLQLPPDYEVAILPGSNTGAFECAMWTMLGARPVTMLSWDAFGQMWAGNIRDQLKLAMNHIQAKDYGEMIELEGINFDDDVVFVWNGTASGVCLEHGEFIQTYRKGLTFCDATSGIFGVELPWQKLDVTTFSWQKLMGGEAAHGMMVLSPRAIKRLQSYTPPWPVPYLFRVAKNQQIHHGLFTGNVLNTVSMLAVRDYLFGLDWALSNGGLPYLIERTKANAALLKNYILGQDWLTYTVKDERYRSKTSVTLDFAYKPYFRNKAFLIAFSDLLEKENAALDIKHYPASPPGLRIWCGPTVEKENLLPLFDWLTWSFATLKDKF